MREDLLIIELKLPAGEDTSLISMYVCGWAFLRIDKASYVARHYIYICRLICLVLGTIALQNLPNKSTGDMASLYALGWHECGGFMERVLSIY